jgi:Skp family chaperone for outer membrane proteins
MNRSLAIVSLAILLSAGGACAQKIVFVDVQEVFKRFYKTQLAQDQIRQQADDIKYEQSEMDNQIAKLKEEAEVLRKDARDETLSDEVRQNKRNDLEEKLVELQKKEKDKADFEKLRNQQIEQQNTRMSRKLLDEVQEAIIVYSKEKGYDGVIDRSAESRIGLPVVLFGSPKDDITADVLVSLNQGHDASSATNAVDSAISVEKQ